jgi:hypothetical protein
MMRYIGRQNRLCSLNKCERIAEFTSDSKRLYCSIHAQYLVVGGQLLKEENELREALSKQALEEAEAIESQLDFDLWWEKHYGKQEEKE